jgi:hypothetical protein
MEASKICSKCNIAKSLNEYHWRNDTKSYRADCKTCINARVCDYTKHNKEKKALYLKEYGKKNKEIISKKQKVYYENNKEILSQK